MTPSLRMQQVPVAAGAVTLAVLLAAELWLPKSWREDFREAARAFPAFPTVQPWRICPSASTRARKDGRASSKGTRSTGTPATSVTFASARK